MQITKEHIDKSSLKKRWFKASLSNDYLIDMLLNAKFWYGCPGGKRNIITRDRYSQNDTVPAIITSHTRMLVNVGEIVQKVLRQVEYVFQLYQLTSGRSLDIDPALRSPFIKCRKAIGILQIWYHNLILSICYVCNCCKINDLNEHSQQIVYIAQYPTKSNLYITSMNW